MLDLTPIEGTRDVSPEYHKYLTFLKKVFRHEFRKNGFRRVTTSSIERPEIISSIFPGQEDDFYKTEVGYMKSYPSVGILRSYLNKHVDEEIQPVYYYYMSKFFSNKEDGYKEIERIGGEIIGENDPILDAILINLLYINLNKLGLSGTFTIRINTVGIEKEKVKYKEELISFYDNKKHLLSKKSLIDLEKNPMLLLNSQDEDEKILASQTPQMVKFLKKDSKAYYEKFKEYLDLLNIPYVEDHTLIGKYSFNTHSVWHFIENQTERKIGGGSRHNQLSTRLETPKEVPATGFSINTEVLVAMLRDRNIKIKDKDRLDLFFVQLGDEAKMAVLPLSLAAREAGINTVVSLGTPSMKEQMLKANRSGAQYVVIVGVMEARNGILQVRNNIEGTQEEVKKEDLIDYIVEKIGINSLDFYCPAKDLIKET